MLDIVELSRLQFALTAMYHFLFVPLTLGMAFLLAIMETVYVLSGKQIYKDMTKFWGKLFGINFALGVATGLTMVFQIGTNCSSSVGIVWVKFSICVSPGWWRSVQTCPHCGFWLQTAGCKTQSRPISTLKLCVWRW